jgi:Arc/MetJ family transcription regulator
LLLIFAFGHLDMDKDNADCRPLIELTAETLDNDTLRRMFVSTQRTTLELCMRYAVERSLAQHLDTTQAMTSRIFGKSDREIVNDLGKWFPHTREWWAWWVANMRNNNADADALWADADWDWDDLNMMDGYHPEDEEMWSALRHLPPESSTLGQIMQFSSAALIVFENAFYLVDEQQGRMSVRPVYAALQQYMASPNAAAVRAALSPAIHTYEAGFSRWIPGSAKHSQKKADLINTITEVVLQHRLPTPGVQAI